MVERNIIIGWGVDRDPSRRPGTPRERAPSAESELASSTLLPQHGTPAVAEAHRPPTAVFGTAVPRRGLSGLLRARAYRIPSYRPKRWAMLVLSDRVDVLEHNVAPLVTLLCGALAVTAFAAARRAARRRSFSGWWARRA